jgi:hypothetical protein
MRQPHIQLVSAPSGSDGGVGVDTETHPMGPTVPYETRERRSAGRQHSPSQPAGLICFFKSRNKTVLVVHLYNNGAAFSLIVPFEARGNEPFYKVSISGSHLRCKLTPCRRS